MPKNTFFELPDLQKNPLPQLPEKLHGKVYADVPLAFFATIEELKKYVLELKDIGVNVLLILPHFLPSLSPYVVKNYEKPCQLFATWQDFSGFMKFVADLGMDRMIDIPFNHADWQAENLKREWFKNGDSDGIEAGADDVDADNNRVRINWGAYILDNSNQELLSYWLEKVIFPHIEDFHVNSIRIDAAWGLDPDGLKQIISETKAKHPEVWFLAENLGMAPLIELAESGIEAGADRFFNNIYWYDGGLYIPTDIYTLFKRSNGVPTCTIFSSHDVLMPTMKAMAKLRKDDVKGLNDKAIARKFVEYENIHSISQFHQNDIDEIVTVMKNDFALAALMTSDTMFAAGSEKCLFERIDVLNSNPESFSRETISDFPQHMKAILKIKSAQHVFNQEGVVIPMGQWKSYQTGLKGFVKTCSDGQQCLVCVNTDQHQNHALIMPNRIKSATDFRIFSADGYFSTSSIDEKVILDPQQLLILTCERKAR